MFVWVSAGVGFKCGELGAKDIFGVEGRYFEMLNPIPFEIAKRDT